MESFLNSLICAPNTFSINKPPFSCYYYLSINKSPGSIRLLIYVGQKLSGDPAEDFALVFPD
ncbi:MAG: hypothetical protein K2P40_15020, partial [Lachnospiraceae bacterium]|nr:hypothetical protein [Lachnospiraceae bacterium]